MSAGSNLDRLKIITDTLTLTGMVKTTHQQFIEYNVEHGTCFGIGILKIDSVAVQRAFLSVGSRFRTHTHDEMEYLIVHQGELRVRVGQEEPVTLRFGQSICIDPGVPHNVEALEDTWLIGLTLPASPGYPSG